MKLSELYKRVLSTIGNSSESTSLDARLIICDICGFNSSDFVLNMENQVSEEKCACVMHAAEMRKNGKPVAYITSKRAFWRHVFHVNENVLIPQPDTETLVQQCVLFLKSLNEKEICILDLCAGSGCVGICIAKEVAALFGKVTLVLSDVSKYAFDCFSQNAALLVNEPNIEVVCNMGNLFENLNTYKFNLIASNPPYIGSHELNFLDKEVLFQPLLALDGGDDGLNFVRSISQQARSYLCTNGALFMEIGHTQGPDAHLIFSQNSYSNIEIFKDLAQNERVVKGIIK